MRDVWVACATGLLGWALTGLVLMVARRSQLLAEPTDRGLHEAPTPVGGGLGLIGAALTMWVLVDWPPRLAMIEVVAAVAALGVLSWFDDRRPLPPAVRFVTQALVVATTLWLLPSGARVVTAVPLGFERGCLAFAWLWLLNLTNFMDGIDGLAGVEACTVGLGYVLVTGLDPGARTGAVPLADLALMLAAASAGYLVWNWAPARIFMGDVGSIPLGFLFGLLLLDLAARGLWAAALILPLYFLIDATITLLDRLRRGVKPWQAHREHAYQRAVLAGLSHARVTAHIAALNLALVALAIISITRPWSALAAALALTFVLFFWLQTRGPRVR